MGHKNLYIIIYIYIIYIHINIRRDHLNQRYICPTEFFLIFHNLLQSQIIAPSNSVYLLKMSPSFKFFFFAFFLHFVYNLLHLGTNKQNKQVINKDKQPSDKKTNIQKYRNKIEVIVIRNETEKSIT